MKMSNSFFLFSGWICTFSTVFESKETMVLELDDLLLVSLDVLVMHSLVLRLLFVSEFFPNFLADTDSFRVSNALFFLDFWAIFWHIELVRSLSSLWHDSSISIFEFLLNHLSALDTIWVDEVTFSFELFQFFFLPLDIFFVKDDILFFLIFWHVLPLFTNNFGYFSDF